MAAATMRKADIVGVLCQYLSSITPKNAPLQRPWRSFEAASSAL
jgi:hypothetical protein